MEAFLSPTPHCRHPTWVVLDLKRRVQGHHAVSRWKVRVEVPRGEDSTERIAVQQVLGTWPPYRTLTKTFRLCVFSNRIRKLFHIVLSCVQKTLFSAGRHYLRGLFRIFGVFACSRFLLCTIYCMRQDLLIFLEYIFQKRGATYCSWYFFLS